MGKEKLLLKIENLFNEKQKNNFIPLMKSNKFGVLYRSISGKLAIGYRQTIERDLINNLTNEQLAHLLQQVEEYDPNEQLITIKK